MLIGEKTLEELVKEMEKNYDALCYRVLISLYSRTKDVIKEEGIIPLKNFDFGNKEHRFVLAIARGLSGVVECQVSVKTNWIRFAYENNKIKVDGSKLVKYNKKYDKSAVNPDDLLSDFRKMAEDLCGKEFTFADIYEEYYE